MEPSGTFQASYMIALLCSVVANSIQAFAGSKEDRKVFTPTDFLPDWAGERPSKKDEQPAQSVEEMKKAFHQIAGSASKKTKASAAVPMKKRKVK